jgi:release factor glutamine methyltransferase
LAHAIKQSRTYLHTFSDQPISPQDQQTYLDLVERRKKGEPIAYLIGKKEFWSLPLDITPDVLIPRPDTELLVETILEQFPDQHNFNVADLGTGSGAIALALAKERPSWKITATDLSSAALELAKKNATKLGLNNITFLQSDWCEQLPDQTFQLIVSNPPYIAEDDPHLQQGDLQFEPRSALVAENQGFACFEAILTQIPQKLISSGWVFFEHGFAQGEKLRELFLTHQFQEFRTYKDLAGHERVTGGRS